MAEKVKKTETAAKPRAAKKAPESSEAIEKKTFVQAEKPAKKAAKTLEVTDKAPAAMIDRPKSAPAKTRVFKEDVVAAPSRDQIAQLAHRFWKERGGHHGSHEQDWLRAEQELRGRAS